MTEVGLAVEATSAPGWLGEGLATTPEPMTEEEHTAMMVALANRVNNWRNEVARDEDAGGPVPLAARLEHIDELMARREAALDIEVEEAMKRRRRLRRFAHA